MLIQTEVSIEKEVDDLMKQVITVLSMIREGDGLLHIFFAEVFKLKQMLRDIEALQPDYAESLQGTLNAVAINAIELATAILGKQ